MRPLTVGSALELIGVTAPLDMHNSRIVLRQDELLFLTHVSKSHTLERRTLGFWRGVTWDDWTQATSMLDMSEEGWTWPILGTIGHRRRNGLMSKTIVTQRNHHVANDPLPLETLGHDDCIAFITPGSDTFAGKRSDFPSGEYAENLALCTCYLEQSGLIASSSMSVGLPTFSLSP
ncbi:hypothetical protein MMC08_001404 [Hypocenomyce scalaris]|nr:hypothetical protein [Hypocenomyce scalaris]